MVIPDNYSDVEEGNQKKHDELEEPSQEEIRKANEAMIFFKEIDESSCFDSLLLFDSHF